MNSRRLLTIIVILSLGLALLPAPGARAATFTVTNRNDSGAGSLRQAILDANATVGPDRIEFAIVGCGAVCTIIPATALPILTDDGTTIDGYTQAGAVAATDLAPATIMIEIVGTGLPSPGNDGLNILSANNVVRGLAINRFSLHGIAIGYAGATGNVISGNYIGTNAGGTIDYGNGLNGVYVGNGATNNTIGGDEPADRNVISGNQWAGVGFWGAATTGNIVSGNYIGVSKNGNLDLGNTLDGVWIYGNAHHNTVGGDSSGERNVISFNDRDGVRLSLGVGNVVSGNYIGLGATGLSGMGNTGNGVYLMDGSQEDIIGGDTAGERNVISDNENGVLVTGAASTGNVISGNYIGTTSLGTGDLGNRSDGIRINGGANNNLVGGDSPEDRNIIAGSGDYGVSLMDTGTATNTVTANLIGTDVNGTTAIGNASGVLISLATGNTIGRNLPGQGNLISGNTYSGIGLLNPGTSGNVIAGNLIGTDPTGAAALANGEHGIAIYQMAGGNTVGPGNLISGNAQNGVTLGLSVSGTVISGNRIGTDLSGSAALGNRENGIVLADASDNLIGGDSPEERNLISGNSLTGVQITRSGSYGNVISGNWIGVDASGAAALGNGFQGVQIDGQAYDNLIGGDAAGEGNLISGNAYNGVLIVDTGTTGNVVSGNVIGLAADGASPLGNGFGGVEIRGGAQNNTVGGSSAGQRNVLSGNGYDGVTISESGTSGNAVMGNYIGTDLSGASAVGNNTNGVTVNIGALGNAVGGDSPDERNVISGNVTNGVMIAQANENVVSGNYIGTDASGLAALPNHQYGISIFDTAQNNTIGGDAPEDGNLISGNGFCGIYIGQAGTNGNIVASNRIGPAASGEGALPNGDCGVSIAEGAQNSTIGPGNTIAHNLQDGVVVSGDSTRGNVITRNNIHENVRGISLRSGGNGGIAFPVIAETRTSGITILGTACAVCEVEIFASPTNDGQGEVYIGSVTASSSGDFSLVIPILPYPHLTATARDAALGTSEFSVVFSSPLDFMFLPFVHH